MEKKYTVYSLIFPNGKRYIGVTSLPLYDRWRKGKGYKKQPVFQAINEFGWENITHNIECRELSKCDAEAMEKELIKQYKSTIHENGYNIETGGFHNGTTDSDTKRKISIALREKKHRYSTRNTARPVLCIELGKVYRCAKEAQNKTGVEASCIRRCCTKVYTTAGGYHWEYVKEVG